MEFRIQEVRIQKSESMIYKHSIESSIQLPASSITIHVHVHILNPKFYILNSEFYICIPKILLNEYRKNYFA